MPVLSGVDCMIQFADWRQGAADGDNRFGTASARACVLCPPTFMPLVLPFDPAVAPSTMTCCSLACPPTPSPPTSKRATTAVSLPPCLCPAWARQRLGVRVVCTCSPRYRTQAWRSSAPNRPTATCCRSSCARGSSTPWQTPSTSSAPTRKVRVRACPVLSAHRPHAPISRRDPGLYTPRVGPLEELIQEKGARALKQYDAAAPADAPADAPAAPAPVAPMVSSNSTSWPKGTWRLFRRHKSNAVVPE